ncbi:MAG: formate dehydrogenase accessory sulfurtransferase FdhD [Lachnospiraceae bacterium]|nr:formate dehydrogenase accessory sulfurtransferase FdhD [Lachnospiraceae bacterium]
MSLYNNSILAGERDGGDVSGDTSGCICVPAVRIYRDGTEPVREEICLLREQSLQVFVNGQPVMKMVCTPSDVEELVMGRLFSEGLLPEVMNSAVWDTVDLKIQQQDEPGEHDKPEAQEMQDEELPAVPSLQWNPEWMWKLADRACEESALRRRTHAIHGALLMRAGEIIYETEDISRHNAIDKAIGYALKNRIPMGECILYTTGRMPLDMVKKAIRAGIPVMAGRKMPTGESLALAEKKNLTLIGRLRPDGMVICSSAIPYFLDSDS